MDLDQMDVDLDISLESNPIKEFLLNKLRAIHSENTKMENQIVSKKQLVIDYLHSSTLKTDSVVIEGTWRKIVNDFYIVGYKIANKEHLSLKVSNILLNWDSSSLITYRLKVFQTNEENDNFDYSFKKNNSSVTRKNGIIILVIEKPNFFKQASFKINGIFVYELAGCEYQTSIPELRIEANDFSDVLLEVRTSEIIKGNLEELLVLIGSYEHYQLSAELTSFISREITAIFVIDCMFRQISLNNRKMFLIDGLSASMNGTLLEILEIKEDKFDFVIMSKNEDIMCQLLHYLYKNIDGIQICPKIENHKRGSLADALEHEILMIEEYYKKGSKDDDLKGTLKFRNELNDVQYEVDTIYCSN